MVDGVFPNTFDATAELVLSLFWLLALAALVLTVLRRAVAPRA